MRLLRYLVISVLFLGLPAALFAGVTDVPAASKWYFHADFSEMRSSEAGRHLYGWLQSEVFEDIRGDVGIDLDKEADTITAYAGANDAVVLVIDGKISQQTQDKILAMGAVSGSLDKRGSGAMTFYHVKNGGAPDDSDGSKIRVEAGSFENGAYFSFAIRNKLIVTSQQSDIESIIANKGRIIAAKNPDGALIVLSAERNLIQAGVGAGALRKEIGWNSNILSNAEQIALLIADEAGKLAIHAQLITTEKAMADSLASIVRGLISLQVFNDDLDPEMAAFLQSTTVDVDDRTLVVKVALDPRSVIETLQ